MFYGQPMLFPYMNRFSITELQIPLQTSQTGLLMADKDISSSPLKMFILYYIEVFHVIELFLFKIELYKRLWSPCILKRNITVGNVQIEPSTTTNAQF